jgi:hypothetical protein
MAQVVPPNGFAGAAQQTPAVQNHLRTHVSKTLGHTKSVPRARKRLKTPKVKKAAKPKGMTILKAGSAAAKAWGAKMAKAKKAAAKKAA